MWNIDNSWNLSKSRSYHFNASKLFKKKIYTSLKAIHNGETLQLTPREKLLKEFGAQMHKDPVTYKKWINM